MPRRPKCPISGCIFLIPDDQLVCHPHALQIWERVQTAHLESAGSAITTESADERAARQAEDRKRRTQTSLTPGRIYFLALDDKIKVGWTANMEQRMKSYPPHSRLIVACDGTRADERDLHRTLRTSLIAGREWYERTPHVMTTIREVELRNSQKYAAEVAERKAAYEVSNPLPQGVRRANSRPLRGQALVRAILAGEDT